MILAYVTVTLLVLAGALLAVREKNLIRAALALCLGGSSLAILFFLLGAPYAGSVQLSTGLGCSARSSLSPSVLPADETT